MRTIAHGQYTLQLTRFPQLFPVNCYLVREDDGLTLIDTAIGGCAPAILAAARKLGLPIQRIVLTHAHGDHVGSIDALCQALPHADVLISAREARLLAGDLSLDADEPQTKIRGSFQRIATQPTRLLADGDRVGSLQVIATPGHTPGHIALFDTRDGTLIAGDAFQTRAGLAVSGTLRWLFPFPAIATWNRETAIESARRVQSLKPAALAVGHGEILKQPVTAIDRAIAVAAQELGKAEAHGA